MQRHPFKQTSALYTLGQIIKLLFICMFICTVIILLASIFGAGAPALAIYQIIWGFFWRISLSLLGIVAVFVMLDGLK